MIFTYPKKFNPLLLLLVILISNFSYAQENLITYSGTPGENLKDDSPAVISKYRIKFNFSGNESNFIFNLSDQNTYEGKVEKSNETVSSSGFSTKVYRGKLYKNNSLNRDDTPGFFSISLTKDSLGSETVHASFMSSDGKKYQISYDSSVSDNVIREIDDTKQIECNGPFTNGFSKKSFSGTTPNSAVETQSAEIRVLIAYTPDAVTKSGSQAAMLALINNLIANANTAYDNSLTGIRLVLAGTHALTTPSNDDFNSELTSLTNLTDGKWDEIGGLREQYCADMVSVFVGGTNGLTICGLAWLGGDASSMSLYKDLMFSVISADTLNCSSLTFAHELGHNLGAEHDFPNSSGDAPYPYAYGYRFTGVSAQQFRTVMAYAPGQRIPYFSNPRVTYNGVASGVTNQADNAQAISLTAPIVAGFLANTAQCLADSPPSATPTSTPNPAPTQAPGSPGVVPGPTPVPTPPAGDPDTISLNATAQKGKVVFKINTAAGVIPVSAKIAIKYAKKASVEFVKTFGTRTNSSGTKDYKVSVSKIKTGFYKSCLDGDSEEDSELCSNSIRIKKASRNRRADRPFKIQMNR